MSEDVPPYIVRKTGNAADGITGKRIDGEPSSEAEHFETCETCGQAFDMRDLGQVFPSQRAGAWSAACG